MQRIVISISFTCRDDVPQHVLDWMAENLAEHAENTFGDDYDPEFVQPSWEGPPLVVGEDVTTVEVARVLVIGGLPRSKR